MLFSILVPVYNTAPYLSQCLDSVLAQDETDYELILVDDGSTDESGELLGAYKAAHPQNTVVVHQENRGLIAARRKGVSLAKGETCIFLDSDDYLEPGCLSVLRKTIEQTGADVVIYNDYCRFEGSGVTTLNEPVFKSGRTFEGEEKRALYELLIGSYKLNNICFKAIARPLLQADDTPYADYFDCSNGEDLLQSLYPLTHAKRVAYIDAPLYNYRRIKGSMSYNAPSIDNLGLPRAKITDMLCAYMTLWGMDDAFHTEKLAARRLGDMLVVFWQRYRSAGTQAERRAIINFAWEDVVGAECLAHRDSRFLPLSKRIQLNAVLRRRRFSIWCIGKLACVKVRLIRGE